PDRPVQGPAGAASGDASPAALSPADRRRRARPGRRAGRVRRPLDRGVALAAVLGSRTRGRAGHLAGSLPDRGHRGDGHGPAGPAPQPPSRAAGLLLLTASFPLSALCFTEAYRAAGQNTSNPEFSATAHALFWLAVVVALGTTGLIWRRSTRGRRLAATLGGV